MRNTLTILLLAINLVAFSQQDTVIIKDYKRILITTEASGELRPVTDISSERQVGFFLNHTSDGVIRICNNTEVFVWVEGRLISRIESCDILEPNELFEESSSDTVYVSISTPVGFDDFKCELVIFEDFQVLREEVSEPRVVRDLFREFNIITITILLVLFGVLSVSYSSRLNFFINKTFALKASVYQFINTSFFGRANVFMAAIVALCLAFEVIYINEIVGLQLFPSPKSLASYFFLWLEVSAWLLFFLLVKRYLIQLVSGLYRMKKLKDWQLFDFINFTGYFVLILFIIVLWDFILKSSVNSWVNEYFTYYFVGVLILFELWFITKFVANSTYQKLLIISYLCATEIIPSIFLMVWFFK